MKSFRLLFLAAATLVFTGCETLQQVTNTTGGAIFSLNGQWQLQSNSPESTLLNSVVTVTPGLSEGRLTTLTNNTQCYRDNDVKWKSIKANSSGGYRIDNLLSSCNSSAPVYQIANISVVNNDEIRISGQNVTNQENVQVWRRLSK